MIRTWTATLALVCLLGLPAAASAEYDGPAVFVDEAVAPFSYGENGERARGGISVDLLDDFAQESPGRQDG